LLPQADQAYRAPRQLAEVVRQLGLELPAFAGADQTI
jgi:hypothetical protein